MRNNGVVQAIPTPKRRRCLTGNAGDLHEKVYLEHPPEKTKPIIDALPSPSSPAT
jgi:hypothetical protein